MQGELAAARLTEGLPPKTMVVVLSRLKASRCLLQRHKLYASPARGYFSMKKSNQKSLGENPETPDAPVRPDRKVYDLPDLGLDDAYKVFILIRFLLHPNQMRRRHLESVSAAPYGRCLHRSYPAAA